MAPLPNFEDYFLPVGILITSAVLFVLHQIFMAPKVKFDFEERTLTFISHARAYRRVTVVRNGRVERLLRLSRASEGKQPQLILELKNGESFIFPPGSHMMLEKILEGIEEIEGREVELRRLET